jgi:hypothetical protein
MADFETQKLLLDRTQPLDIRRDAAVKLVKELEHYELRRTFHPVFDSEAEDPVLRVWVLAILACQNAAATIGILVSPFEDAYVRRGAIDILNKVAPVRGYYERLLTAELSALRGTITQAEIEALVSNSPSDLSLPEAINLFRAPNNEDAHNFRTIALAQRWGRDPRVLEFLNEELQNSREERRRHAVFCLCMLGELQPALEAANDLSPAVRATLAERLGYYRESAGIVVLKRLFADSDPEVAKEAKTSLRLLNQIDVPPTLDRLARSTPWGTLLAEISCAQLEDRDLAVSMPDHKLSSGWLGEEGASEAEIACAEQRLGVKLPPSYRAFLAESNGFDNIGPFIYRLYNVAEIEWFRVRDPQWVEAWQNDDYPDASREEHLADPKNCVVLRRAYLSSCLQISDVGDSAVVLLNPEVVNGEGEWETWFFSNWGPGATRYPSFRAYIESELESIKQLR